MSITEQIDGTCAFVAMSMLLSYYDTYWNDTIVEDNLEWQQGRYDISTDYLYSTFNANEEVAAWNNWTGNKKQFVEENKGKYLQSYLIDMCNELPIIDEAGVFAYQTQDLLEYYLYEKRPFTENQITVHFYRAHNDSEKEIMINTAKSLIENGHPVIFSGLDAEITEDETIGDGYADLGAHSMIGYDYEETEGAYDINLNLCCNNSIRQTIRTTQFQYVNSIIRIEINNLSDKCSGSNNKGYRG